MSTILFILAFLLVIISVSSILTLAPHYRFYKKIYKELPTYNFYIKYGYVFATENKDFIYFVDRGDFCLADWVYISSKFYTYFDPYSFYWLIKYRNWFRDNVNIENLPVK